jgi:hypothetical protein
MQSQARLSEARPSYELVMGAEVIEVRIDGEGIHFRHPGGSQTQGHIPWEVALAMCMLPMELKRTAA